MQLGYMRLLCHTLPTWTVYRRLLRRHSFSTSVMVQTLRCLKGLVRCFSSDLTGVAAQPLLRFLVDPGAPWYLLDGCPSHRPLSILRSLTPLWTWACFSLYHVPGGSFPFTASLPSAHTWAHTQCRWKPPRKGTPLSGSSNLNTSDGLTCYFFPAVAHLWGIVRTRGWFCQCSSRICQECDRSSVKPTCETTQTFSPCWLFPFRKEVGPIAWSTSYIHLQSFTLSRRCLLCVLIYFFQILCWFENFFAWCLQYATASYIGKLSGKKNLCNNRHIREYMKWK